MVLLRAGVAGLLLHPLLTGVALPVVGVAFPPVGVAFPPVGVAHPAGVPDLEGT